MYSRTKERYEKALGPEHVLTLGTFNNFGLLYQSQGMLGEAGKMFCQALEGYKHALGQKGIATYVPALETACNMALLLDTQGDVSRAEAMYSKALTGYEEVFGRNHQKCKRVRKKLSALQILASERNLSTNAKGDRKRPLYQGTSHSIAPGRTKAFKRREFFQS